MSSEEQGGKSTNPAENILKKSPFSGIAVPVAIVLVGALIIFGITRMLSSGKDYRDLVQELNSKTFGNRWVAAYELSKYLASSSIPKEEIPWLIENLSMVYDESVDPRTRNFVILALGSTKQASIIETVNKALRDPDPKVRFNAVVVLGNLTKDPGIDWVRLKKMLKEEDPGMRQAIVLTYGAHVPREMKNTVFPYLKDENEMVRLSSAIALIGNKEPDVLPLLRDFLKRSYSVEPGELDAAKIAALKLNILEQVAKYQWEAARPFVKATMENDSNEKVSTKAKQVLNLLKN